MIHSRRPCYLVQFCIRPWMALLSHTRSPLIRLIFTQDPSLHGHYPASSVLRSIWLPSNPLGFLTFIFVSQYSLPWRITRICHVHTLPLIICYALRPRSAFYSYLYRFRWYCLLSLRRHRPSHYPRFRGSIAFIHYGLQSSCLGLTLFVTS